MGDLGRNQRRNNPTYVILVYTCHLQVHLPKAVEIAVIRKSAKAAPAYTASLLYRIAIIAAMKKVYWV